jgi:tryptophan halogenase
MNTKKVDDIVVIGGGTAGWLTALLAKQFQPNKNVVLIESQEFGILGAGEGTVPWFPTLLAQLNIPVRYLIKRCKATIKQGILFENWNGNDDKYFHSFGCNERFDLANLNFSRNLSLNSFLLALAADESTETINISEKTSLQNKVGSIRMDSLYADDTDEFAKYHQLAEFALHFDARELADALKDVALARGIIRVEGIVSDFDSDENGITSINLKDGQSVKSDFIFDCSGFRRLVIGKHFGSTWKSVRDTLPCDSAIPFFIENKTKELPPYTSAIAMDAGWAWKIPVQGRYGCGYVYDSRFTTEEKAKQEVISKFGDVSFPTKFTFDPGYYEEFWIKNCIAVGLSSGFLEPLEATSIWITTHMVQYALESFDQIQKQDQFVINEYNEKFRKRFDDTVDFLRLHYITQRDDTDFWKHCKQIKNSDRLNSILKKAEKRILHYDDFKDSSFELQSWLTIFNGIGLMNQDLIRTYLEDNNIDKAIPAFLEFTKHVELASEECTDHYELIEKVRL